MAVSRLPVLVGLVAADVPSTLEVVGTVGALAAALGAGVAIIVWARRAWRQDAVGPTTEDQLAIYQHLLDEGTIDAEEFERICARLHHAAAPPPEPAHPAPHAPATGVRPGLPAQPSQPPRPTDLRAGPPPTEPPSAPSP